jgi:REP-associated tyrosine transposase
MEREGQPKRRRSIRLAAYDYRSVGAYCVTVCVKDRACVLGRIAASEAERSDLGQIVQNRWEAIPAHFPWVALDAFIVMPNHAHGITI